MTGRARRGGDSGDDARDGEGVDLHRVHCRLDELLEERGMTLTALAQQIGATQANVSKLKNNHARAIRFSTLTAICDALGCDVGDLLRIER